MSDRAAEPLGSWPPPRTRPWWVPAAVIGICTCLVAAALFVADRVGQPTTSRVAAFLPADGAGWYGELRTQGASGASTATTVTESATIVGTAVTGGLDWGLAAQLIGAAGSNPIERTRFWRTTTTTIDAPRGEHQASLVYRIAADIALMVESGPGYAYTYTPNLVELPQAATAGASWQSHGAAGTASTYTAQFSAEAAGGGCLRVVGTISYSGLSAGPRREVSRTWCPGQGIVSRSERANGVQLSDSRIDRLPKPLTPNTTEPRYTWNPAQWQQHQLSSGSVDPTYGTGPMSGAPSAARPGMTASGVLIRTNTSGQDVMGFTPANPAEWQSRWRAHPGGTVLTVTVYGDVVVATTSARRVVGYTDTGVRLWDLKLDEVVMTEPTRASDSEVALVTVGGEVVVADLASGQVRWHGTPGSDVGLSPVVSGGVLVVADRAGHLIGLNAVDGSKLWQSDVAAAKLLAANNQQVMVADQGDLYGFDLTTGARIWRAGYSGIEQRLSVFADWVVLIGEDGALAFDPAGRLAWSRSGVYDLSSNGTFLVCWGNRRAEVLDMSGASVTTFTIPIQPVGSPHRFLAAATGVYLLDSSWDFKGWSSD